MRHTLRYSVSGADGHSVDASQPVGTAAAPRASVFDHLNGNANVEFLLHRISLNSSQFHVSGANFGE